MKTTKILTVMLLFVAMGITSKVNAQSLTEDKKYYYFAYAEDYNSKTLYITPVQYKKVKYNCSVIDAHISVQFRDYIESEFKGNFITVKGSTYHFNEDSEKESIKSKMTKSSREIMKWYENIVRVRDFEFLCED